MKKPLATLKNKPAKITTAAVLVALFGVTATVSANTTNTTISSIISPVITLFTTNGTVNVNVLPTGAGAQTIASDTVTVSTNDSAGYTLSLADTSSSNTNLVSGANTIPTTSGTFAAPVALTSNKWGYRVDGIGGFGAGPTTAQSNIALSSTTFAGMPVSTSPQQLKSTSSTASNDTTTVWYSVAADTTQPTGTYTSSVTYTATTN